MRVFGRHKVSQLAILKAADVELATGNQAEELKVLAVEEIKPAISSMPVMGRFGDLLQVFEGGSWIVDRGNELQITAVGGKHEFEEIR